MRYHIIWESHIWTNTVFEYGSSQSPTKVSNLIRQLSNLSTDLAYVYIPLRTSAVNKTVNYPRDLPRGRATNDKSDCFDGIPIRGRLYVYLVGALGCTRSLVISVGSRATSARGLVEGRGTDEYIRLKLIGIVPRLISRSWWFVAASDRR